MRILKQLFLTAACIALYFGLALLAVGVVIFTGCAIYAVWSVFLNLLS